jgi:phosphoenolpyruvate carboxykinase (ATP)
MQGSGNRAMWNSANAPSLDEALANQLSGSAIANLGARALVEEAIGNGEGRLGQHGALLVEAGRQSGCSARDRFIVCDAKSEGTVRWGKVNVPMAPAHFANLKADFLRALAHMDKVYVADLFGGSQPEHRVNVRVINELAWHNLFVRNLLVRPKPHELHGFTPEYTIIDLPSFRADPVRHGSRSRTVIAVNFSEKLVLIGGTTYAGEMKTSVFGILNYLLPARGVMPMHCSANIGATG